MSKSFNKRLSILTMLSLLTLGGTISASAIEVDTKTTHGNSIAIISTEQGKEDRINVDYRVPRVKVELWQDDVKVSEEISDDWGTAFFDNVPPGDYELRMDKNYRGLSLTSDSTVEVSIAKDSQEVFYNTYNGNVRSLSRSTDIPKGVLEVNLKSEDNAPLSRGEIILQGITNKNFSVTLVADSKGLIRASNLTPGEYVIKQSKERAKELNYTVSDDIYKIEISPNKTSDLTIKNKKIVDDFIDVNEVPKAKATKTDTKTKQEEDSIVIQVVNPDEVEEASNIEVKVYNPKSNTEVLQVLKTDEYGTVRMSKLNKGTYEYQIGDSKERVKFNIEDYESLLEQNKSTAKSDLNLGVFISQNVTTIGIVISSLTVICIWLLVKRNRKPSRKGDNKLE